VAIVIFCIATAAALLAGPSAGGAEFVAPYVVSPQEDVERMLELADVGHGDYLIDLGSGDGRIVITAALRGAMGHGVELDRELVAVARRKARAAEVGDSVTFLQGDIFEADLSHASVVTMYLMPEVNLQLRPKLLAELAPGTRVLSNSFDMGTWRPDRHVEARTSGGILLWIVPARVGGRWSLAIGNERYELAIEQRFQEFQATLSRGEERLHVLHTALDGRRIAFLAGDGRDRYAFSGRVEDQRMTGLVQVHGVNTRRMETWQASRHPTGR
jgi:hypothetical protein